MRRLTNLQLRLYRLTTKSHLRIGAGEGSMSLSAADNAVIQALFYLPPTESQERATRAGYLFARFESARRDPGLGGEDPPQPSAVSDGRGSSSNAVARLGNIAGRRWAGCARKCKDCVGRAPTAEETAAYWRVHPTVCDPLSLTRPVPALRADGRRPGAAGQGRVVRGCTRGRANPCPVCQVFGYVGQRGRVRVQHAFPAQGKLPLDIITRVAINRISGAADEGKLFDMEAVPPGAMFYFFVVLENMNDAQVRTFESGVRALQLQLATLGAHSTVGFGTVEVRAGGHGDYRNSLFDAGRSARARCRPSCRPAATGCVPAPPIWTPSAIRRFYRALAMADTRAVRRAIFDGHVTIQAGAG